MSNELNQQGRGRIIIRIGQHHLSFTSVETAQADTPINYEPYVMKSGISVAANLREALKGAALDKMGYFKALVLVDAPVLLIPVEIFEEPTMEAMYSHSFPRKEPTHVFYNVLPDLNAVAVFGVNKDLKTVLDDHFSDMKVIPVQLPVWRHLHKRSFTGAHSKLYSYLHDKKLDIFAFQKNRFKFYNQFETRRPGDVAYFQLYVWKQLQLDADHDELHLIGEQPGDMQDGLADNLRRFLKKVYVVNPQADFNRAPATKVKDMPFDLVTLLTKGR